MSVRKNESAFPMNSARKKFALAYLLASSVLLLVPFVFLWLYWYPLDLIKLVGGYQMFLIAVASTFLGPVISFFVYKDRRILLWLDVLIMAFVQFLLIALAIHGLHQGRPLFLTFVKDDFRVIRPVDINQSCSKITYSKLIFNRPQWFAAQYSNDEETRQRQMTNELMGVAAIETCTDYYVPLDLIFNDVRKSGRSIAELELFNNVEKIKNNIANFDGLLWLPIKGVEKDGVVMINDVSGSIYVTDLAPWE